MMLRRSATLSLATLVCAATPALGQVAPFEYPPPPDGASFEPIEDNPYFTQDDSDPRILHRKGEPIIDRGYVQKMVRGDLPTETLDMIEAAVPASEDPVVITPPDPIALPNLATVVDGNVIIVEGSEQLVPNTERGRVFNHGGTGINIILNQVWGRLGDQFDFITVMTTFADNGAAAYYMPLRQDVAGLGECNFNSGETFGCIFDQLEGQLQGFVFMNSMEYWRSWDYNMDGIVHPTSDFNANVYPVMGQEIGHRWGAGLRFVDPRSGAVSKQLLGRDNSHWAAWVDTDASVMDGWDWEVQGDGTFKVIDDMRRFSTLDLYAMGALPVGQAKPFFFIDGARFQANSTLGIANQTIPAEAANYFPSVQYMENFDTNLYATGNQVDLTVQDIVNAEGNRCPDPDHTQKSFKQAIVLVTLPGQSAAQVGSYVEELNVMMATWEDWWKEYTGKALTLCTESAGECLHAEASMTASAIINDGKGYVEQGDEFELVVDAKASGDTVRNARVRINYLGNGAEETFLQRDGNVIELGDIPAGGRAEIAVPMKIGDDYPCGYSVVVKLDLISDNAATVTSEHRIFPGYDEIFSATFNQGDDGFAVNVDGYDENDRGAMLRQDVTLNCTMSPRTPEDDASPGGDGAWVTGPDGVELKGTTSVWSPELDLTGTLDPEVRFMYWLDAPAGSTGSLTVRLSTGSSFKEAKVYNEPYHGWVMGRVVINDHFEEPPENVFVLFEFNGDGQVEGAIDDVRVLDRVGFCAAEVGFCGCNANTDGEVPAGVFFGLVAVAAVVRRRRRRAAA